ncbi:MAG: hypothetical protein NTV34_12475 [Proteobacteria bacterium]|nr:hypothetical protein [Pseudomonadota bacterium]
MMHRISKITFNLEKAGENFLLASVVVACFPFTSPGYFIDSFKSDIQPWASVVALIWLSFFALQRLMSNKWTIKSSDLSVALIAATPFLYFSMVSIAAGEFFARQLYSWFSVFIFTLVGLKVRSSFLQRTVYASLFVWSIVGIVQATVHRRFLDWSVYRMHASTDRGFTSLSVEPSTYGNHVLLLICVYLLARPQVAKSPGKLAFIATLTVAQVYFISQAMSSVVFGSIIILVLSIIMLKNNFIRAALLVSMIALIAYGPNFSLSGRKADLFVKLMSQKGLF